MFNFVDHSADADGSLFCWLDASTGTGVLTYGVAFVGGGVRCTCYCLYKFT